MKTYDQILKDSSYVAQKVHRDLAWEVWKMAKGFDKMNAEDQMRCDNEFCILWGTWAVK